MGRTSFADKEKHHGLSIHQETILLSLRDGRLYTFQDIVRATGIYSGLVNDIRQRHEGSLGSMGLVRESAFYPTGTLKSKRKLMWTFQITERGCALLHIEKPLYLVNSLIALDEFQDRYARAARERSNTLKKARSVGLQGKPYLLLHALADGEEKTFAELARSTGIFSGMPQYLRARHGRHRSLASLGLISESQVFEDDKAVFTFQITKAGKELLARAERND